MKRSRFSDVNGGGGEDYSRYRTDVFETQYQSEAEALAALRDHSEAHGVSFVIRRRDKRKASFYIRLLCPHRIKAGCNAVMLLRVDGTKHFACFDAAKSQPKHTCVKKKAAAVDEEECEELSRALSIGRRRLTGNTFCYTQYFATAAEFADALVIPEDKRYFIWWLDLASEPGAELVFLRIPGTTALETQRALLAVHLKHGVLCRGDRTGTAFHRHAVFEDADGATLLAINAFALRSYRLVTMDRVIPVHSMPLAPLFMQAWTLTPANETEYSVRRFGMLSSILFIARILRAGSTSRNTLRVGNTNTGHARYIYGVAEPGFALYERLPEFISFFHDNNMNLQCHLYMSFRLKEQSNYTLCSLLAAFIYQKALHCLDTAVVLRLCALLGSNHAARTRYPIAYRLLLHMHDMTNGVTGVPAEFPERQKAQFPHPGHHYLYEMCFDTDLLPFVDRYNLLMGLVLDDHFDGHAKPAYVKERLEHAKGLNVDHSYLSNYDKLAPKKPCNPPDMAPFTLDTNRLWPLNGLFFVLRAFDHQQKCVDSDPVPDTEAHMPGHEEVNGPLRIGDPTKFSMTQWNLPVVCKGTELRYFDDTLWIHSSTKKTKMAAAADRLVRDPEFYKSERRLSAY